MRSLLRKLSGPGTHAERRAQRVRELEEDVQPELVQHAPVLCQRPARHAVVHVEEPAHVQRLAVEDARVHQILHERR
eukprot:3001938-Alexandrium_andersonii.AAC.1